MESEKKLYLHIGFGKTGTTSIQDGLYKNREILKEGGVLYPTSGLRGTGHHNLAILGKDNLSQEVKERYDKLISEIECQNCNRIFISSEFFVWLKKDYIEFIKQKLSKYDVKLILYVRSQVDLLVSAFLQWQKVGDNYQGSIEKFFSINANGFDYMRRISPFVEVFGEESIMARVYDRRIVGEDVRLDILKFTGIDIDVDMPETFSNISLLPEYSSLLSLIDNSEVSGEDRKRIIAKLLELSVKFKALSTESLVSDSLKHKIIEKYLSSNEQFARKFLDDSQVNIFLDNGLKNEQ